MDFFHSIVKVKDFAVLIITGLQEELDSFAVLVPLVIEVLLVVIEVLPLCLEMLLFLFLSQFDPAQVSSLLLVLGLANQQSLVVIPLHVLVHDLVLRLDDF